MLKELLVQNFSIIENTRIDFEEGFNILTGESGSGKSVLIQSIAFLAGGRGNKKLLRQGADKAFIQGTFLVDFALKNDIENIVSEQGFEVSDEESFIISRELYENGRTLSRLNGRIISLQLLKVLGEKLLNIYGQHSNQGLLHKENYLPMLDSFISESSQLKSDIQKILQKISFLQEKQTTLPCGKEKEREIELLNYQIEEIEAMDLQNFSEDKVFEEYKKLSSVNKIVEILEKINKLLEGDTFYIDGLLTLSSKITQNLSHLADYGSQFDSLYSEFIGINSLLSDFSTSLRNEIAQVEENPDRMSFLERQLSQFSDLKRKYGPSLENILSYYDSSISRKEELISSELKLKQIKIELKKNKDNLSILSEKLSRLRKLTAQDFQINIENELKQFNMPYVQFSILFHEKEISRDGKDDLDFYFSANKGELQKPLSEIISGGELSRLMLAFKAVLQNYNLVHTLIFDEIDTGLSGRAAQIIGERLFSLGKDYQIIAISHLPQVAAMADSHYMIEKRIDSNRTYSYIYDLNEDYRIRELARLVGGVNITEKTLEHVKEMLALSDELKKGLR